MITIFPRQNYSFPPKAEQLDAKAALALTETRVCDITRDTKAKKLGANDRETKIEFNAEL